MITSKTLSFTWFVQWGIFLTCTWLSASFAVQLYSGLVNAGPDRTLVQIGAVVVEAIKILSLVIANTAFFSALAIKDTHLDEFEQGLFSLNNRKKITDTSLLRSVLRRGALIRQAILMYSVYVFCALITIAGTLGFVLTQVYEHSLSTQVTVITSDDLVGGNSDKIQANRDLIVTNKETIVQNKVIIADLTARKGEVDTNPAIPEDQKQSSKDGFQRKIQRLVSENTTLSTKNTELATENQKLTGSNTTLKKDDETNKQKRLKDVYELIGEALGQKNGDTIRLVLLALFASIIDLGLFLFSPHFNSKTEEEVRFKIRYADPELKAENTNPEPEVAPKRKRAPRKPKVVAITPEAVVPVEDPAPVVSPFEWPNLEVPAQEPVAPVQEVISVPAEETLVVSEPVSPPSDSWIEEVLAPNELPQEEQEELDALLLGATPSSPKEVEAVTTRETLETIQPQVERFLDALYDSTDGCLVERDVASKKAGVPFHLASSVFDFLVTHQRDSFKLINFDARRGVFYAHHPKEVAKKEVIDHLLVVLSPQA